MNNNIAPRTLAKLKDGFWPVAKKRQELKSPKAMKVYQNNEAKQNEPKTNSCQ